MPNDQRAEPIEPEAEHPAPDYYVEAHGKWVKSMWALRFEAPESVVNDVERICVAALEAAYEFGKEVGRGDR